MPYVWIIISGLYSDVMRIGRVVEYSEVFRSSHIKLKWDFNIISHHWPLNLILVSIARSSFGIFIELVSTDLIIFWTSLAPHISSWHHQIAHHCTSLASHILLTSSACSSLHFSCISSITTNRAHQFSSPFASWHLVYLLAHHLASLLIRSQQIS